MLDRRSRIQRVSTSRRLFSVDEGALNVIVPTCKMSRSWSDSLDETMDFSVVPVLWGDGPADATTQPADPLGHAGDSSPAVDDAPSDDMAELMAMCGDPSDTGLSVRLEEAIQSNCVVTGFTCTHLRRNGALMNTGAYTLFIRLRPDVATSASVTIHATHDKDASPVRIYADGGVEKVEVRATCRSIRHDERRIEMDWGAFYRLRVQHPTRNNNNNPPVSRNLDLLSSIAITDLDMCGRISLYGYLHALWSTTLGRFLTIAYSQRKTLKWSACIHPVGGATSGLRVHSQVGKTSFSVSVNRGNELTCKLTGHWTQGSSFEPPAIPSTRIASCVRMRSISDAIRSTSIIHAHLFGGIAHQLELATNENTAIILSALSYDMYTTRSAVDVYPAVSLLDVANDQEFHVRMLYFDATGTLVMSATGKWISVYVTTSRSKPLPKATMARLWKSLDASS